MAGRHSALAAFLALASIASAAGGAPIDLTRDWRFMRDQKAVGTQQHWERVGTDDRSWSTVVAGRSWQDQGFAPGRGYGWYRKWVNVPSSWRGRKVWLVLGGLNDCGTVYCNGKPVSTFGNQTSIGVAEVPIVANLTAAIRPGARNLLALCVFDYGGAGAGLWRRPCMLTTNARDLPVSRLLTVSPQYRARRLLVEVDLRGLGTDALSNRVRVSVRRDGEPQVIGQATARPDRVRQVATVRMPVGSPAADAAYTVSATMDGPGGSVLGGTVLRQRLVWPSVGWKERYRALKVRNNFVTELLTARLADGSQTHRFTNPRTGWVYFRVAGTQDEPNAVVDDRVEPVIWRIYPRTGAREAMLRLSEGAHAIRIDGAGGGTLDIRTVPEIAYCYFPANPLIPAYGAYDWAFCEKYVFPHVNTLVTGGVEPDAMASWAREGRRWIANAGLPGLSGPAPSVETAYDAWSTNAGFAKPHYSGLIVDEFLNASDAHYRNWSEAVRRLHANADYQGRDFYAWCGDIHEFPAGKAFCQQQVRFGYPLAWERYLAEQPTQDEAEKVIYRDIVGPFRRFKAAVPGVERHMVLTLGYLCAPPESLNLDPSVDYQVFMDMQFRTLATEAEFFGLYGVMEYSTRYADEESLRFAHELIRHYCIEGATEPLTSDPYRLTHLRNPDFAKDLSGWKVEAAAPGSVGIGRMEGYSWLHGRYPRTDMGEQFCRMTRSADRPNRLSQELRGLTPGRLYSVKMISADMSDLHAKAQTAVSLSVEGAETVPEHGFQQQYPSLYDRTVLPYTPEHPAWMCYHRLVFRASAETARLVISDWSSEAAPGGPIGHQTAVNFVEVQPFHAP